MKVAVLVITGFIVLCASACAAAFHPLVYAAAPIDNPLKGFAPYDSDSGRAFFPHSLEWFYIPLSDLMPTEAAFDWAAMEKHLNAIAARHCQAVMRVYLDYPGKTPGTPAFLLKEGVVARPYDGRKNAGKSLSPDYEDPRLRAALTRFIAAFGAKYDGDPRLGFITLGLLGYWGEWHTSDHKEWFASKAVQTEVMSAYLKAFQKTRLLVRYPAGPNDSYYADNHALALGYHDDSFAWATRATGDNKDSWFFMVHMAKAGALDKWRTQPIGGEVRPEVWDSLWDDPSGAPKRQEFLPCVEDTHVTWLMNTGAFRKGLTGARRDRALAGARRMGYELQVTQAAIESPKPGALELRVRIKNLGVAPFYYPWSIEVGLLGESGKLLDTWRVDWDLRTIELGAEPIEFSLYRLKIQEKPGIYTVAIRAANPLPTGKPLRFANQEQDQTLPDWLTLGTVHL